VKRSRIATGLVLGAVLVAGGILLFGRSGSEESVESPVAGEVTLPQLRNAPPHPQAPDFPPEPSTEEQVARVMRVWRQAIVERNAEPVLTCDRLFRAQPERYLPALRQSAQEDSEERVRAFSTRVLGKLQDPSNAKLFIELLADRSPFVRGNAVLGLGKLGPGVHRPLLERLARRDPHPLVRRRVQEALSAKTVAHNGPPAFGKGEPR